VKLLILPVDGLNPVVTAIKRAKKSIDMTIFRFDRPEVEKALSAAVDRGVRVRALIAHTNRGGERLLRKLEMRLLAAGVTVARSADDLVRYHGKMLIIDERILHVLLFNYTALDARSRSFGVVTRHRQAVAEGLRLFESDVTRQPFAPGRPHLVISPENARQQLSEFIRGARRELLIYDPKVSDTAMLKLLDERASKGVDVRILGGVGKRARVEAQRVPDLRLHARAIVRDGRQAFLGSQSLRAAELDTRREIGIVVRSATVVKPLREAFLKDWSGTPAGREQDDRDERSAVADARLEASA
jgi:phosphatidylserine/phosphatidylglycerophosphate/cardiolipin synthase-like enzyme